MNILVQVTVFDDDGKVLEQIVKDCGSQYYWEVERMFEQLGKTMAKKADPSYED